MKQRRAFGLLILAVLLFVGTCGVWLHLQQRQYTRNQKLIDAVLSNDTKTALALIKAGADPNTRPNQPFTFGFRVMVDRLLRRTPAAAVDSSTAFLYACGSGLDNEDYEFYGQEYENDNYELVQAMLAHGANLHLRTPANHTALWGVVCLNRPRVVKLLLEHGADVNEQYKEMYKFGATPLMTALQYGRLNIAFLLLSYGAKTDQPNIWGDMALHLAVRHSDNLPLFRQLLAHGADPTLRNKSGQTAIESAQEAHRPDVVALLRCASKHTPPATNRR